MITEEEIEMARAAAMHFIQTKAGKICFRIFCFITDPLFTLWFKIRPYFCKHDWQDMTNAFQDETLQRPCQWCPKCLSWKLRE